MPTVNRSALVMYSAEQMFNLINDVLAYPQFLPDCSDSKILEQTSHSMKASLKVSKAGINKWFTTENTLVENKKIVLNLIDGPFNKLVGSWNLIELSEGACKVTLDLDYEFSNKMFDLAFGRVFTSIANNMVQSFTSRAKEVYA